MKRSSGYIIDPHIHYPIKRITTNTQEVLIIKQGKVRVDFFDNNKMYLTSRLLSEGDVILLCSGGHGFEFIDTAEIIEIKQGPYDKNMDKIRFKYNPKEKNINYGEDN